MPHRIFVKNGILITPRNLLNGALVIEDGEIAECGFLGEIAKDAMIIDAKGMYVAPGFVEIHAHGGGGADFMDATPEAFFTVASTHRKHGTTSLLPTTVACSKQAAQMVFSAYRSAISMPAPVHYLGLHLEGPYIANDMRGAQNAAHIRPPAPKEVDWLMDTAGDILKLCTTAPELAGTEYMAAQMQKRGIFLSCGHSAATYSDMLQARKMGFCHITHLYSGTTSVRKINQTMCAGILEAAYLMDDMRIELIGDGHHVPKEVLLLALKLKGAHYINLTTDAMRAAGTFEKESFLGQRLQKNRVIVEDGVAKLPDKSSFAGSIATGDGILKWAVLSCGIPLTEAVMMLSLTPASVVGADDKKGSLEPGKDADIIFLNQQLTVVNTILSTEFKRMGSANLEVVV